MRPSASNTVKFNTATVLTASTTAMTATVPSGAPTGPVSVTQRVEDLVDQRNSFRKEVAAKQIPRTSVEPFE